MFFMEKTYNADEPGRNKGHPLQCPLLTIISILGYILSEICFPYIFLVCKLGLLLGMFFFNLIFFHVTV